MENYVNIWGRNTIDGIDSFEGSKWPALNSKNLEGFIEGKKNKNVKGKKEKIRVYILTAPKEAIQVLRAEPKVDSEGNTTYHGYAVDVWKELQTKLEDRYEFEMMYSRPEEQSYTKFAEQLNNDEFDIVIGLFAHRGGRIDLVNFATPIFVESLAIVHQKRGGTTRRLTQVFQESIKYVFILLAFGLLFGFILHLVEPKRGEVISNVRRQGFNLRRSLLTSMAAAFGEMGFLTENATLKPLGLIVIIVFAISIFVLLMFIQAEITAITLEKMDTAALTWDDVKGMKLLAPDGWGSTDEMKSLGIDVQPVKDLSVDDMIKKYKKESDRFDGVQLIYGEAAPYPIADKSLSISYEGLPYRNAQGYAVNPRKTKFLIDVNVEILNMQNSLQLQQICKSYYDAEFACQFS